MLLEHALSEILLLLTYPENAKPLSDNEGPVCSPRTRRGRTGRYRRAGWAPFIVQRCLL